MSYNLKNVHSVRLKLSGIHVIMKKTLRIDSMLFPCAGCRRPGGLCAQSWETLFLFQIFLKAR